MTLQNYFEPAFAMVRVLAQVLRKQTPHIEAGLVHQAMDLEAREHEARPLLGNFDNNKLATVASKQEAYLASVNARNFGWHLLMLIPAPQILFMGLLFFVNRFLYWHSLIVIFFAASFVLVSLWAMQNYKQMWRQRLAKLTLMAAACGLLTGCSIYYSCTIYYFHYKHASTYASVVPSQSAESILDAGIVSFAVGSMVDRSRSVGFQSSAGFLVCVAPIVDGSMSPGSLTNFYAYGINCCSHRGNFNCDDARNPSAHHGMLLPDPSDVLPPLLADISMGPSADDLQSAVKLQQAAYSRTTERQGKQTFVQYVADPLKVQVAYIDSAVVAGLICSVLFFMGLCFSVSLMVLGTKTVGSLLGRLVV
ncbi:unnamed protein product [Durusdinium trenchii]|uniref:Uncharacterized protein n=2 Tax=Durusdinium trenchii TaxID=1381693 RepID=A0ABP0PQV2_9DINO